MTDIFLLLSYGGPESLSEVRPFLERIAAGRSIPLERLDAVEEHYALFGGKSPLNQEASNFCQRLRDFIFTEKKTDPPAIYWGNLFAPPLLKETLLQIIEEAATSLSETRTLSLRVMCATPFYGAACNERYQDALQAAVRQINQKRVQNGESSIDWKISYMPPFAEHSLYVRAVADTVLDIRARMILEMGTHLFNGAHLGPIVLFTAHALPERVAQNSHYRDQIAKLCRKVVQNLPVGAQLNKITDISHAHPWDWIIAYQSRSGSSQIPWTGPTTEEVIQQISLARTIDGVLVVPIGFFFENMEILYDLDTETARLCKSLNLNYHRASLASTRCESLQMVADFLGNTITE